MYGHSAVSYLSNHQYTTLGLSWVRYGANFQASSPISLSSLSIPHFLMIDHDVELLINRTILWCILPTLQLYFPLQYIPAGHHLSATQVAIQITFLMATNQNVTLLRIEPINPSRSSEIRYDSYHLITFIGVINSPNFDYHTPCNTMNTQHIAWTNLNCKVDTQIGRKKKSKPNWKREACSTASVPFWLLE